MYLPPARSQSKSVKIVRSQKWSTSSTFACWSFSVAPSISSPCTTRFRNFLYWSLHPVRPMLPQKSCRISEKVIGPDRAWSIEVISPLRGSALGDEHLEGVVVAKDLQEVGCE